MRRPRPFPSPTGTFGTIVALNVLDCVTSPHDLLAAVPRLLSDKGRAVLHPLRLVAERDAVESAGRTLQRG